MKLSKITLAVLGALTLAGISTASANMISGTVGFTSSSIPAGSVTQSGGTTTIHFNNPFTVNLGTDDYATTKGLTANFTNFSYTGTGTGATLVASPISPEWTFMSGGNTYSFTLESLTSAVFKSGNPNSFALSGEGFVSITGFEDTFATYSLQGTGNRLTFTILQASNTAVPAVPEGGSALSLLGLGLVAIEGVRRKLVKA